jgi:hypothetical protein
MGLYEQLELLALDRGETPVSLSPHREAIEHEFVRCWAAGENSMMENIVVMLGLGDLGQPVTREPEMLSPRVASGELATSAEPTSGW